MLSDTVKPSPGFGQIYFKDGDGNFVAVDADNPLPTNAVVTGEITIDPGDIEVGAVELKDGATDQRAVVDGTGQLSVKDAAVIAAVDTLEALITATNAALVTIDGHVDGVEAKLDTLNTSVVESRDPDGTGTTNDDVTVDATSGGVQILAANSARKGFIVQNTGANAIRVSIGSNATTTHGIQLAAGASMAMSAPYCPVGVIKAIREGANSSTCAAIEVV